MKRRFRIHGRPGEKGLPASASSAGLLAAALSALALIAAAPATHAAGSHALADLLEKEGIEPADPGFPVPLRLAPVDLSGESGSSGDLSDRWHSSDAFKDPFRDEFLEGLARYLKARGFELGSSGEALRVKVMFTEFEGRKRFHDDGGDLRGRLTLVFRGETIASRPLFESLSYRDQAEERPVFARKYGLPKVHFATVLFYRLSLSFYRMIEETILAMEPAVARFFEKPAAAAVAGQPPAGTPGGKGMDLGFAEPGRAARLEEADFPIEEFSIFDITSVPEGAEIHLDGKLIAMTPAESVRIPSGTHTITVRKRGYADWTREMLVLDGNRLKLIAELEKPRQ